MFGNSLERSNKLLTSVVLSRAYRESFVLFKCAEFSPHVFLQGFCTFQQVPNYLQSKLFTFNTNIQLFFLVRGDATLTLAGGTQINSQQAAQFVVIGSGGFCGFSAM